MLFDACGRRLVVPKHIVHCSDIVYRYRAELARSMKYRLVHHATGRPLKVVDHVGCHYNKLFPQKSVGGTEYCDVLTAMVHEWGGAEVDYPERRHCCGMGFRQCMIRPNRSFTVACARKKFESMAPYEPDLVLTNCPGCLHALDHEQWAVNEVTGANFQIPVLNYAGARRSVARLGPLPGCRDPEPHGTGGAVAGTDRHPQCRPGLAQVRAVVSNRRPPKQTIVDQVRAS